MKKRYNYWQLCKTNACQTWFQKIVFQPHVSPEADVKNRELHHVYAVVT